MAASTAELFNIALVMLGAETIIDVNEDTKGARTLLSIYASTRQDELRKRRWRFGIKRVSLAALVATPDSDYAYQYQKPSDMLRLLDGADLVPSPSLSDYNSGSATALWAVEGDKILTSLAAPLAIRYIADITDVSLWDASCAVAVAAKMAQRGCYTITQSTGRLQFCMAEYKDAIREAARTNAIEGPSQDQADDTWIAARTQ